jgi:hypothetical protein
MIKLGKLLNGALTLTWIIDILNIGANVNGFNLVEFLDVSFPINTLAWFLILLFVDFEK